jgi:hypothetical protein
VSDDILIPWHLRARAQADGLLGPEAVDRILAAVDYHFLEGQCEPGKKAVGLLSAPEEAEK